MTQRRVTTPTAARARRWPRFAALVVICLGLGACGVPIDSAAHRVQLGQAIVPAASPNGADGTPTQITLYFARNNKLEKVTRPQGFAYSSIEATGDELLEDLDAGPLSEEEKANKGLVTLLNSNPGLTCTYDSQTKILTVKLDVRFVTTLYGSALYQAYGQIVLTLMQSPLMSSVTGVTFTSNGALVYPFLPNSTVVTRPVTTADYASLIVTSPAR